MGSHGVGEANEREDPPDRRQERMTTDHGRDHMIADVEPTKPDTARPKPSQSHEKEQIFRSLNPTNFEE